jgi:ribonuclease-3
MPTSNTHPQTNKVSGSYSSHKFTSKRPLPIKSSQKPHSSSSSSTRTDYKKSHQHSAHEDEPITPLDEYSSLTPEEIIENEKKTWTRCAPADLYYARDLDNPKLMRGTDKLKATIDQFRIKLLERGDKARTMQPKFDYPPRKTRRHSAQCGGSCKDKSKKTCESDSSSSDSSSEEEDEVDLVLQELERKKQHPSRLHPELWFNDPGEMNDGPLCRCR